MVEEAIKQKIKELHTKNKMSAYAIGKQIGYSQTTVISVLRELNCYEVFHSYSEKRHAATKKISEIKAKTEELIKKLELYSERQIEDMIKDEALKLFFENKEDLIVLMNFEELAKKINYSVVSMRKLNDFKDLKKLRQNKKFLMLKKKLRGDEEWKMKI